MFCYRFPIIFTWTVWCLYFLSIVNITVFIYLTVFMCKLYEELQLLKLMLENSDINDKKNLVFIIKKYSKILDYGQEVCNFATTVLFPQHCLYSGAVTFLAVIIITVSLFFSL